MWKKRLYCMLLAVLEKRCGYFFGKYDVFLNIAGGLKVVDPGIDLAVAAASRAFTRFSMTTKQERLDLLHELEQLTAPVDMSALEEQFVIAAQGYSERKGISWTAWREVGVPASVLERAGVSRGA